MQKNQRSTKSRKTKATSPTASAKHVLAFLNSGAPDFLTTLVWDAIDRACEHVAVVDGPAASYAPQPFKMIHEPGYEKHDMNVLTLMCQRTRMVSLADLEKTGISLARHILAVYEHPRTPVGLFNSIGNFITDGTSLKVSACEFNVNPVRGGDSTLLDDFTRNPRTVERVIEFANKYNETSSKHYPDSVSTA